MVSIVFALHELLSQDNESIEFAKLAMRDINAIVVASEANSVQETLETRGIDCRSYETAVHDSLESFLSVRQNDTTSWYLVVTNQAIDLLHFGEHFAHCPYQFWGEPEAFKNISFTEHAKKKLLYNELSRFYMDSIANNTVLEVNFLKTIFDKYCVKSILDCCCGVGRHAARLGDLGFAVTGIDASQAQIATAMRQNKNGNVNYAVGDVREFSLEKRNYDAAICMWTTYNYFSQDKDLLDFLANVWEHLHTGGILILDTKNILIQKKRRFYHRQTGKDDLQMTLLIYKRVIGMIQNSQYFYFIDRLHDGRSEKMFCMDEEFVRHYPLEEMIELLNSRYVLIKAYGDFLGNPYDPETSERMITLWQKTDLQLLDASTHEVK